MQLIVPAPPFLSKLNSLQHTFLLPPLPAAHASATELNLRVLIDGMEWSLPEGPDLVYKYKEDAAG